MLDDLKLENWIELYISWELLLIKELGYEDNLMNKDKSSIKKSLQYNRNLLMKNFIIPNNLRFPLFRNTLESYFL